MSKLLLLLLRVQFLDFYSSYFNKAFEIILLLEKCNSSTQKLSRFRLESFFIICTYNIQTISFILRHAFINFFI